MMPGDSTVVSEAGGKDGQAMKREILKAIIYRTAALLIFTVLAIVFLLSSYAFLPSISAAIILYVESVSGKMLTGKIVKPLSASLKVLALTVFCTMFVIAQDLLPAARGLGIPIFVLGIAWSLHYVSKAYSEFTGVVTRSVMIAAVGFLYYSIFSAANIEILTQLGQIALVGIASSAVFSLLGILKRHDNAYLSYVGNTFARLESPVVICIAVAAILTYVLFIRQSLMTLGLFGLTLIEWAALCAAILLLFMRLRSMMRVDGAQKFGDVQKIAASLGFNKGELKNAASKVEDFVMDGKKDGLVAIMAAALIRNDVPVDRVQGVISAIVDHEDEREPPLMFRWAAGNVRDANRKKRLKAVGGMMEAAASAMNNVKSPAAGHRNSNIDALTNDISQAPAAN
jgi:hypothetical protein